MAHQAKPDVSKNEILSEVEKRAKKLLRQRILLHSKFSL